jgi:hypothetical protein
MEPSIALSFADQIAAVTRPKKFSSPASPAELEGNPGENVKIQAGTFRSNRFPDLAIRSSFPPIAATIAAIGTKIGRLVTSCLYYWKYEHRLSLSASTGTPQSDDHPGSRAPITKP